MQDYRNGNGSHGNRLYLHEECCDYLIGYRLQAASWLLKTEYRCTCLTESIKSPASIAKCNKQWVGT